jgi:flagellar basal body-associated protein FliL
MENVIMRKINRCRWLKFVVVLLIALMVVSLAACSSSKSFSGAAQDSVASAPAEAPYVPPSYSDNLYPSNDETYLDVAEAPMAVDGSGDYDYDYDYEAAAGDGGASGEAEGTVGDVSQSGRKITFSAVYSIETKRFDEDYGRIVALVKNTNGYIANENTDAHSYYSGSQGRSSWLTLRIPVGGYDTFLTEIDGVGDIVNKGKSSQDLTSQYFDTESRIELLEMRKTRLIEYIEKAEDPEVIIEFERELTNVLYDLDSYQGTKRGMDQMVDYATVDVTLYEVITAETIGKDGEPLGERAQNAFQMSLNGVGDFLRSVAVFFAGAVPVIVLIVVILIIIWLIVKLIRWIRRKYNDKHAEKVQARQHPEPPKTEK